MRISVDSLRVTKYEKKSSVTNESHIDSHLPQIPLLTPSKYSNMTRVNVENRVANSLTWMMQGYGR